VRAKEIVKGTREKQFVRRRENVEKKLGNVQDSRVACDNVRKKK